MVTLNTSKTKVRTKAIKSEVTRNNHDVAYTLKPIERLIERTLGAFWNENLFYTKGSKVSADIVKDLKAVAKKDPKFPLQLAAFARNELYLRTTPQVLLVEAANIEESKKYVREYTPKIVKRADELSEVIAYQLATHGKPIPNSLKKGLADAFANFDEYQLNKYDSDKGSVSLGDVLKLIARKDNWPVSKALRNYLINDEVDVEALPKTAALKALLAKDTIDSEAEELIRKSSVTWETLISKFGSTKENWERVIPNMGYMALLRNLRNFEQKNVDLKSVLEIITNEEKVKRSKQLPFRFYSAYTQTSEPKVKRAIAQAFEHSISNVKLDGRTAVIVDLSGSMAGGKISEKSNVSYRDIAAVLGAVVSKKSEDSVVIAFADHAKRVEVNPDDTMITSIQTILRTQVGGATYAHKAFENIGNEQFDRIILLSDMQCYGGADHAWTSGISKQWDSYVAKHPKAHLYSIDLSAYGTKQLPTVSRNTVLINGWSDKIIDFVNLTEKRNVMESEIRKY